MAVIQHSEYLHTGVDKTVGEILKFIRKDKRSQFAYELSRRIVSGCDGRDIDQCADVLYKWIIGRIQYFYDPHKVEWVMDLQNIIRIGTGDCDDFTVLSCTLLESLGIKTRVTIAQVANPQWNHVYAEYWSRSKKQWIPFDTCVKKYVGWKADKIIRTKNYNVE